MKNYLLLATLAAGLGLAACNSQSIKPFSTSKSLMTSTATSQTAPASATAAKPAVEAQPKESSAPAKPKPATSTSATMLSSSLAYPSGDEATSALLIEKLAPRELLVGQPFDYQIQVTNLTSIALSNVVITDSIPAEMTVNKLSPKADLTDGVGRWNLGSFQPNEAKVITINATAKKVGTLNTCASVSYETGLCMSMPVVAPAIDLAMTGPAEVLLCDKIELRYTVRNTGTGSARGVVVGGNLPMGLKTDKGLTSFSEKVGDLAPGKSHEFVVVATAAKTGEYVNAASATTTGGLTAKSSNVTTVVHQPVLEIEKTGTEKTFVGRDIKYVVTVTNTGDAIAEDTFIEDSTPANTTFKSATVKSQTLPGGKLRWSLGNLPPGQTKTVEMVFTAAKIGTCDSKAVANAVCADSVGDPHRTEIVGIPAILLEVVDLADPIEVGADATYEIRINNQGSAPATGVTIDCTLPANVQYVSSTGELAGAVVGNAVHFKPVATLAPQKQVTFRVVVRGMSAADARFKVSMTSDQLTSPVEETEATNYYK